MDAVSSNLTRVHQWDALRGFAVLMILFANIFAFAYPLELAEHAGFSEPLSMLATVQHQLYLLLVRGKFISLLTLVFGASLYLLYQQSFFTAKRLKARMAALLLIGLCHAIFVWSGDVLVMYAVVGFGLLLQQVWLWTPEKQLSYAKSYLLAGLIVPLLVWQLPSADSVDAAEKAELMALYSGSYAQQLLHQLTYLGLLAVDLLLVSYWWCGGMMLLAIWGMQSDWQQLLNRHFLTLLSVALACALLPLYWTGFSPETGTPLVFQMLSDLCFALVYLRLFVACYAALPGIAELLRRCGRCSLSLYLWQSIVMVLLFRWIYPEWFGSLGRDQLTAIAAIFILLQLLSVRLFYRAEQLWWFETGYRQLSQRLERFFD